MLSKSITESIHPLQISFQFINSRMMVKSSEHKIKGFADDLTLISSDREDYRNALSRINLCASDLDLVITADKCYNLSLKGLKQDKKSVSHFFFLVVRQPQFPKQAPSF